LLKKGETVDAISKTLRLDKAGTNLLANPKLDDLTTYVKMFNKANPSKQTSLVATFTKHYGDLGLAKIIEAAATVKATAPVARRWQFEQVSRWIEGGKTQQEVFQLLKLNRAGKKLLVQPGFSTWVKFSDTVIKQNPDKNLDGIISILKTQYKYDDKALLGMFSAAEKVPQAKALAKRLQTEQIQYWLRSGETPVALFKLLKVDAAGDELLASPLFGAWLKYTDDFHSYHPDVPVATIETLTAHYTAPGLAKMIAAASKSSSTEATASRLQSEQFKSWFTDDTERYPAQVFKVLGLDKTKGKPLDSPLFGYWATFVEDFNKRYPAMKTSVFKELNEKYNSYTLSEILIAAKENPATRQVATDVQLAQLQYWLKQKYHLDDVFDFLNAEAGRENAKMYKLYREMYKRKFG
jgi:hypothetical protein